MNQSNNCCEKCKIGINEYGDVCKDSMCWCHSAQQQGRASKEPAEGKKCALENCEVKESHTHPHCDVCYSTPTNLDQEIKEWEKVAAKTTIEARKKIKHYAEFSKIIYQGFKVALSRQRSSIVQGIEGLKKEIIARPQSNLERANNFANVGYNQGISDASRIAKNV